MDPNGFFVSVFDKQDNMNPISSGFGDINSFHNPGEVSGRGAMDGRQLAKASPPGVTDGSQPQSGGRGYMQVRFYVVLTFFNNIY